MKPFCHRTCVREVFRVGGLLSDREDLGEPKTRTHCDQTRRNQYRNEFYRAHSDTAGDLPCPQSYPQVCTDVDTQGKKHRARPDQNPQQHLR